MGCKIELTSSVPFAKRVKILNPKNEKIRIIIIQVVTPIFLIESKIPDDESDETKELLPVSVLSIIFDICCEILLDSIIINFYKKISKIKHTNPLLRKVMRSEEKNSISFVKLLSIYYFTNSEFCSTFLKSGKSGIYLNVNKYKN